MSKRNVASARSTMLVFEVDPTECPFREFRDNELSQDYWGLGPAACRAAALNKTAPKLPADYVWVDDHIQPLPQSVRQYLHGWVRAEDLAVNRWGAEVLMFDENNGGKMSIMEMQLSHAQVLLRSSFCRQVLSACYMLERVEGFMVEHQWENFIFNIGLEGWRPRYHIYSPGMKPGGGPQHKPGLSKNGCYLVRLFYLGTWRCVWVSDQVPIDATGSPLLPFSPLCSRLPPRPGTKVSAMGTPNVVYLWALLLCKALLKLAAPDMSSDEDSDCIRDELMPEFNIMHALTGTLNLRFFINDPEEAWKLITSEVPVFGWDDDDDTQTSTIKSRSTKKPTTKDMAVIRRSSFGTLVIADTKNCPAYTLPGITPAHEMSLLVTMARDLPLKKPLPEPDVPQWKTYRWVNWARRHGLYEAYDCPRTRFLKVNGLMKLSYAPHLLDVQSTQSITRSFREQNDKTNPLPVSKKGAKEQTIRPNIGASAVAQQMKEELREWVQYNALQDLIKEISICYYPSMFKYTTATSHPSIRITKALTNKALDIAVPKTAPLYLQIDSPDVNVLKISLSMLHPRVLFNAGIPVVDYIEPAYLILEIFEWFVDCELPVAKSFVRTKGYDSVEVKIKPGRHFCRLWIHSRMAWHVALLSESQLLLGTRDLIQAAAVKECPWASKFLSTLGTAFSSWIRINRSNTNILTADKEFYKSYKPDLQWDDEAVGYSKCYLHWMFRQALQSLLFKKLTPSDFYSVCSVLRRYFCDPNFGFSKKPKLSQSLREIASMDPCDCEIAEPEDVLEELNEQQITEEKPVVDPNVMEQLLTQPTEPNTIQVCDLATEELPCGVLKNERKKILKMHEAAGIIQAYWRGKWARKCLREHVVVTPEFMKLIMESTFGNLESLSALMNEFFGMFPGTRNAYSVASALCGVNGLHQYHGTAPVTPQCKWIPYFQGVFYCHAPVKVHFDIQSSLQYSCIAVYNNDTGEQIPQAYNAHTTFDFSPNDMGYTVMGHGTLNHPLGHNSECYWQLSVLSSIAGNLHVCDNDLDSCKETPLPSSSKFHIDEIFLPNRRNILGGIQIAVSKHEAVSFRACATSSDLEITAILSTKTSSGDLEELDHCAGKGEIYWPYIRLEPMDISTSSSGKRVSLRGNVNTTQKGKAQSVGAKNKSNTKLKDKNAPLEPKQYLIHVIAPAGWPLTLDQWKRVDEIRNSNESCKIETPSKKTTKDKEKTPPAKEKPLVYSLHQPLPGDAYVELECAFTVGGGATGRREDERDLEFAAARRSWDANEPGRSLRGAQIRKEFRAEFLEATTPPPSESFHTLQEEIMREEIEVEEERRDLLNMQQRPTPATESELIEMTVESEEEGKYLTFPEQLKDKFIPLYFLPFCMKERDEELTVLITPDMAEAAKQDRQLRIETAMERMRELQVYNEIYVLGRQKTRGLLLEKLFVDSQWSPDLQDAFEKRDDAIATENLNRTQSATKKKQEGKKK